MGSWSDGEYDGLSTVVINYVVHRFIHNIHQSTAAFGAKFYCLSEV
uniref:Uncharacterized protein n=1 Tax=Ciona intestinalis TaxID=7719 RepID=H2XPG8_CIOIN